MVEVSDPGIEPRIEIDQRHLLGAAQPEVAANVVDI